VVSPGELQAFGTRIRRHGNRVDQLAATAAPDLREALLAALAELELLYEDLLVADEELRVQGEELRGTQARLAASRVQYQELFDAATTPYLVTTLDGVILNANLAAAELLGAPPRRGAGKPVQAFIELAHRRSLRQLLAEVRREGGAAACDLVLVPRHGRPVLVAVTITHRGEPATGDTVLRWSLVPAEAPGAAEGADQPAVAGAIPGADPP
jgi:PAS domain-containing protein